jgi:Tol biopolymer transport system component
VLALRWSVVVAVAWMPLAVGMVTAPSASPAAGTATPVAALPGHIVVSTLSRPAGVFSMLPDGTNVRRLVDLRGSSWGIGALDAADDGSKVAMTLSPHFRGGGHIYVVGTDGAGFTRLTRGGDDSDPSLSPDGLSLVFSRSAKTPSGHYRSDLYRVNTDGTGLERLTVPGEPQAMSPSWSPDGKTIAYFTIVGRQQSLVLTDPTGTWFRFVRTVPRAPGEFNTLNWSPDSATIIYGKYEPRDFLSDLWTIHPDGTGLTRITDTANRDEESPSYAPDGSAVACSLQAADMSWADVLLMNPDGTGRHRISSPRIEFFLSWGG